MPTTKLLLSQEERREIVQQSLGSRFTHHGDVFLPTSVFYQVRLNDQDLQRMHKELAAWLGIPSSTSNVHFASNIKAPIKNPHRLVIKDSLRNKSQVCAAVLVRYHARRCLERRRELPTDPLQAASLIDLFTLEYGLGLVLINGFAQTKRLRHGQSSRLSGYELANKNFLAPRAYTQRFIDFAHQYHLDIAAWGGYLTPRARHLLPRVLSHTAARVAKRPNEVRQLDKQRRLFKYKTLGLSLLACLLMITGIFVTTNRPKYLPIELSAQREKIDQLRSLYQICSNTVLEETSNTDQSNIFINRTTEADANRCVSLRNKYNYEVDQYNQAIKQLN